jgi:predicted nucleic acid-binding protein
MTSDPYFLDSNVLIYSIADGDLQKRAIASEILKRGLDGSLNLYLSPQILLEFYSIATNVKEMRVPLVEADAKRLIEIIISSRIKLVYPGERTLRNLSAHKQEKTKVQGFLIFT